MVRAKIELTHLDGYPAALIRIVSRTPQARSCCTARPESNLQWQGVTNKVVEFNIQPKTPNGKLSSHLVFFLGMALDVSAARMPFQLTNRNAFAANRSFTQHVTVSRHLINRSSSGGFVSSSLVDTLYTVYLKNRMSKVTIPTLCLSGLFIKKNKD